MRCNIENLTPLPVPVLMLFKSDVVRMAMKIQGLLSLQDANSRLRLCEQLLLALDPDMAVNAIEHSPGRNLRQLLRLDLVKAAAINSAL